MASYKGIALKGISMHKGHEGEPLAQCNIYMHGKKIGWYSDGDWGGESILDIEKDKREEFSKISKEYFKENPEKENHKFLETEDMFILNVMMLMDYEKFYNKAIKKQPRTKAIAVDGDMIYTMYNDIHIKDIQNKYPNAKFYYSNDDFIIK